MGTIQDQVWHFVPGFSDDPGVGYGTARWISASPIFFLEESQTDAQSARWPDALLAAHFPLGVQINKIRKPNPLQNHNNNKRAEIFIAELQMKLRMAIVNLKLQSIPRCFHST